MATFGDPSYGVSISGKTTSTGTSTSRTIMGLNLTTGEADADAGLIEQFSQLFRACALGAITWNGEDTLVERRRIYATTAG